MAIKNLLPLSRVNEFRDWMESKGWIAAPKKGIWEALRLIKPGEQPVIIYGQNTGEYATFEDKHFPWVRNFIKETR